MMISKMYSSNYIRMRPTFSRYRCSTSTRLLMVRPYPTFAFPVSGGSLQRGYIPCGAEILFSPIPGFTD
ncbi:hypothetical protein HOLleu_06519 [Holothuria leucospilota]|uniref:Uncharacterized protein n=1 Tax=Holothuria leucospilota TaxID=206669 RepID=A0A9Q1CM85_HOLLE|nr:hypothetical protein HOLleu_06519 [Holothuria leucospilota]